jgi:hypothetical protein
MDKTRKTLKFQGNAKRKPRTDMAKMCERKGEAGLRRQTRRKKQQ